MKTNHSDDALLQGQQQQVHNQSMQNQDQIQDIPETMQMWQEAIKEEQMKSILENKSVNQSRMKMSRVMTKSSMKICQTSLIRYRKKY